MAIIEETLEKKRYQANIRDIRRQPTGPQPRVRGKKPGVRHVRARNGAKIFLALLNAVNRASERVSRLALSEMNCALIIGCRKTLK